MHHIHIDRFAGLESPVHRIDSRLKLIAALLFILIVVLTADGSFFSFGIHFALISVVLFISGISPSYIFKRSLTILPFVAAVSVFVPFITPGVIIWNTNILGTVVSITDAGIEKFFSLCLKAYISFFASAILVSTTRFGDLMWAAGKIGLPSKLVIVISFMYRYLFLLIDEASHMLLARDLRSSGAGKSTVLKASGGIIGALFVRSFEHAEKLYYAMLLRGYTGHPAVFIKRKITVSDVIAPLIFIIISLIGTFIGGKIHV